MTSVDPNTKPTANPSPGLQEVEEREETISPLLDPFSADLMAFWADMLNDIEATRIVGTNRYRTYTSDDVEKGGHGLPKTMPEMEAINSFNDAFNGFNNRATLELKRTMKAHPLYDYIMDTKGLGLKTTGRYLAAIGGDPAWNNTAGQRRTLRQLWSYSGLAVVDGRAPRRQRGKKSNWKSHARTRAWNIAQPIIKGNGPYRDVYDETRAKYKDGTHTFECVRCGPSGKPALVGSPLSLGHAHARAIRSVMKEVTRDMWRIMYEKHEDRPL